MIDLYEIQYKFLDELNESGNRCSNLVVYDSETELGGKLRSALDDECFDEVDNILSEQFGIKDDDVCFYYDWNGMNNKDAASLILELQQDQDIMIYDLTYIEGV